MKRIFTLFLSLAVLSVSFAATAPVAPPKHANDIFVPIGNTGQKISLLALSEIKVKDLEKLTGQELKLTQKAGFKLAQRELRKSINADGTIKSQRLNKFLKKYDSETGFHLGGFALGFFLGLIGVLIAYLAFSDANKRNRVKWTWIGLGSFLVLYILLAVALI